MLRIGRGMRIECMSRQVRVRSRERPSPLVSWPSHLLYRPDNRVRVRRENKKEKKVNMMIVIQMEKKSSSLIIRYDVIMYVIRCRHVTP
jgi:hypothetical protein